MRSAVKYITNIGLLVVGISSGFSAHGQSLKLDSAAQLDRNGGIPGAYGSEYNFVISSKMKGKSLKVDSIWINNPRYNEQTIQLTPEQIKTACKNGKTTLRIKLSLRGGAVMGREMPQQRTGEVYNNAAIIYYSYKGKHKMLLVKKNKQASFY